MMRPIYILSARNRQLSVLGVFLFIVFCIYSISSRTSSGSNRPPQARVPGQVPVGDDGVVNFPDNPTATVSKPKAAPSESHPILHLIAEAEREFEAVKARQSKSLSAAVAEYRRRYGLPPPPHFDKWWAFAKKKNVQLVDEFDTIHELLTPFWGLKPSTIRARAREALGYDNALMGMQIRGGNASHFQGGEEWMQKALAGMVRGFIQYLPDMDLAFNIHDESRVVVPYEDLERLVHKARTEAMPAANAEGKRLRNGFTEKHGDLNYNGRFNEVKQTRFNHFAHQPVWSHSRMSCPPDSPSRILEEEDQYDDLAKYALGELGFVYNWTAMSDICLSPSLANTYGFFERPNAYHVAHDLIPIFSQSKISSYADLIYPSPWYWADKVPYSEDNDMPWSEKLDRLYWRGSTTGGFSRNGGWRRQHRQRVVQRFNAPDQAKILSLSSPSSSSSSERTNPTTPEEIPQQQQQQQQQKQQQQPPPQEQRSQEHQEPQQPQKRQAQQQWTVRTVPRGDFRPFIDVAFSHVGQCDPGDCDAQRAFFALREYARQEDALAYKHALDLDGNAFSGRFYALLRSRSLVYKWAIFREWHAEWLRPWAHYVPLSLRGDEWMEVVRFLVVGGADKKDGKGGGEGLAGESGGGGSSSSSGGGIEDLGAKEAERLAMQGREWAAKVLRNEDMEVWFFRLLLE
ncbi:hypothetical protein VTK26DRAFT_1115 [Humicola hyalothermophila]